MFQGALGFLAMGALLGAGCASIGSPSYGAFRNGDVLGLKLGERGRPPTDLYKEALLDGAVREVADYTSEEALRWLRIRFLEGRDVESAEVFGEGAWCESSTWVAALWTPRRDPKTPKRWRETAQELDLEVTGILGWSEEWGPVYRTADSKVFALIGPAGAPEPSLTGILRVEDEARFFSRRCRLAFADPQRLRLAIADPQRCRLMPLAEVRARVEEAIRGDVEVARDDARLLAGAVTGEGKALAAKYEEAAARQAASRAEELRAAVGAAEQAAKRHPVIAEYLRVRSDPGWRDIELIQAVREASERVGGPAGSVEQRLAGYRTFRAFGGRDLELFQHERAFLEKALRSLHEALVASLQVARKAAEQAGFRATAAAYLLFEADLQGGEVGVGLREEARALLDTFVPGIVPAIARDHPKALALEPLYGGGLLLGERPAALQAGVRTLNLSEYALTAARLDGIFAEVTVPPGYEMDGVSPSFGSSRYAYRTSVRRVQVRNPDLDRWLWKLHKLDERLEQLRPVESPPLRFHGVSTDNQRATMVTVSNPFTSRYTEQQDERRSEEIGKEIAAINAAKAAMLPEKPPLTVEGDEQTRSIYPVPSQSWEGFLQRPEITVKLKGRPSTVVQRFHLQEVPELHFEKVEPDSAHNVQGFDHFKPAGYAEEWAREHAEEYLDRRLATSILEALELEMIPGLISAVGPFRSGLEDSADRNAEGAWVNWFFGDPRGRQPPPPPAILPGTDDALIGPPRLPAPRRGPDLAATAGKLQAWKELRTISIGSGWGSRGLATSTAKPQSLRFSPDGTLFLVTDPSGHRIHHAASGQLRATYQTLTKSEDAIVAWSPRGDRAAIVEAGISIGVINPVDKGSTSYIWLVQRLPGCNGLLDRVENGKGVRSVGFSGDGKVVGVRMGMDLQRFDAATGEPAAPATGDENLDLRHKPAKLREYAWVAEASMLGGRRRIHATTDGSIILSSGESGRVLHLIETHGFGASDGVAVAAPEGPCLSPDERYILGRVHGRVYLIDGTSGTCLPVYDGDVTNIRAARFSGDGRRLVIATAGGAVRVLDVESGVAVFERKGAETVDVVDADISPDGRRLLILDVDAAAKRSWATLLEAPGR